MIELNRSQLDIRDVVVQQTKGSLVRRYLAQEVADEADDDHDQPVEGIGENDEYAGLLWPRPRRQAFHVGHLEVRGLVVQVEDVETGSAAGVPEHLSAQRRLNWRNRDLSIYVPRDR